MRRRLLICAFALAVTPLAAHADDAPAQRLSLKNHVFVPQELTVPAHQKIRLVIKNEDSDAAEFESEDLNREKVVPANGEITVWLDPLAPGTYGFFDDFHEDTTTGKIIAR